MVTEDKAEASKEIIWFVNEDLRCLGPSTITSSLTHDRHEVVRVILPLTMRGGAHLYTFKDWMTFMSFLW